MYPLYHLDDWTPAFPAFLAVCCILIITSILPKQQSHSNSPEKHLPCLKKQPYLLGLDTLYQDIQDLRNRNSSHGSLLRHQAFGPTYVSTVLGRFTIHTIDPAIIFTVTTHKFSDYGKGDWARIIARHMGKGVLVNDGYEWAMSRRLLKPFFKRSKALDVEMFEGHVDRLVENLKQQDAGEYLDMRKKFQMVVLDITTEMLCGNSTNSLLRNSKGDTLRGKEFEKDSLLDLIDKIEPYGNIAIEMGPLSLPVFLWNYRRIMALVRGIQEFFQGAVSEAASSIKRKQEQTTNTKPITPTIVENILAASALQPHQAQGELQNIFFAAFDTTTALLTNLFNCISRDRAIQETLKAELKAVLSSSSGEKNSKITSTQIARLTYLHATTLETLRLHSPITYHTRKARVDTFIPSANADDASGVFVPKGTAVTWSTYTLNRQISISGDSDWETFRPGRWLEERSGHYQLLPKRDEFMPFGSGARNCLGQQFAMLLVSYVAARVLVAFDRLEHEFPKAKFEEAAAVTYYDGRGTRVRLCSS